MLDMLSAIGSTVIVDLKNFSYETILLNILSDTVGWSGDHECGTLVRLFSNKNGTDK